MEKTHFKTIIIGGGSAGYAAARTACETDPDCAVIDSSPELGGLCILRGCMPSKTLIYSAEVLHHIKHSASFGLPVFPEIEVDMQVIKKRKNASSLNFPTTGKNNSKMANSPYSETEQNSLEKKKSN